ncbi:lactaldehyde dehydrogenase/glycolaldehyde dehydrogenase [Pseudomonas citronellolis]|uniref:aldehyde dehydrogenase n=1 Tax=Pseudomonas citronellolis TaxID=53408 RepID=UPI00209D6A45|nr:aldehyde dehydrogenase [Pseudomonas citronellolis]MCP1645922.1 lactaldehyde dehydrogenase/glycolaldehyde dehydrogenase [Pseudomonas citronellolis]MCP1668904.1 lactaldehyde dehydrogenase/glycolaldehyde dehydrogenase [Pseudomonas citronellolis]MCP1700268.1 lactaldehyde dehydrogenase/glycolaldehyde dehydrogenase [Pseudomonas citronellolis]MCP1706684.1 lactaldehyde dehydrogenase/glycolaldehyde dehydrogenase [Pseudomonas citronellolis]MCP1800497.1 lactaldehyde dehydrogenase/glycolaldehyde dehydr
MTDVTTYQHYIDNRFVAGEALIEVRNPANGELLARIPEASAEQVDAALGAARMAQKGWAAKPAIERAGYLRRIAGKVRANAERLARIITAEQGKVPALAEVEVAFTADYLDYMAEWARRLEGEVLTSDRAGEHIFLLRKPLGVVAGILPWNFPFFLIARKMAPALLTGNTIVVKPSEETPINCFEFAALVAETDLPRGVFNVVGGTGGGAGQALTGHAGVDLISFTGSVATGSRIMAAAAPNITKLNLELGGKAPAIVLADADLDLAVNAIKASRVINSGQVCNCAERVYVQRRVADAFIEKVAAAMAATRYGDPGTQADLDMGPLVNQAGLDKVAQMVRTAQGQGAQVITGGAVADLGRGFHYQPTVLAGCSGEMEIMRKEIFGPVLPIQVVDDLDEAIALANASEYGLTSSIYTRDLGAALKASRELDFGETYINRENFEAMQGFHAGTRKSGIGGADGKHGLYEYTHTHVVYVQE